MTDRAETIALLAPVMTGLVLFTSLALYFLWTGVTLMVLRAAKYALYLGDRVPNQEPLISEAWIRSKKNPVQTPYILEITSLIFFLPGVVLSFACFAGLSEVPLHTLAKPVFAGTCLGYYIAFSILFSRTFAAVVGSFNGSNNVLSVLFLIPVFSYVFRPRNK